MTRGKRIFAVYLMAVVASRIWIAWGPFNALSSDDLAHLEPGGRHFIALNLFDGGTNKEASGGATAGEVGPATAQKDVSKSAAVPMERAESVRLAYKALGPPAREAVVLLHGSPGSLQDFDRLGALLGAGRYVLIPDMAGFGRSERDVPDYSFVAQADYLRQLLDRLGVERVHLVAFSWGAGSLLNLPDARPTESRPFRWCRRLGCRSLSYSGDTS